MAEWEKIRAVLDENGFSNTPIMSYSVKYASAFMDHFRDAAGSAPAFGDRKGYQMDPHNLQEAIREAELDIQEGADIFDGEARYGIFRCAVCVKRTVSISNCDL